VKLPKGDRADLGTKLSDYVLNSEHRRGRHKARVFESSLGITRENQQLLADALRKAAADSADVISMGDQGFGETFEIRFSLATDKGQATVLSGWDRPTRRRLSSTCNSLYCVTVTNEIHMHDVVALTEDVPATHFITHRPLQLRRGQVGTVVMTLDENHFQVEFSDREGRS
jgi:Domain of unknown function (DUF4926)